MKSELLKKDVEKVLNLLDYAFELADKSNNNDGGVRVAVTRLDLERADIKIENLANTLHYLKDTESIPGLKIEYIFDFVNGPEASDYNNPDPYPSFADLVLPNNFLEISEKLQGASKGELIQHNKIYPPFWLPKNLRWDEITIQFKDGHDVVIKIRDKSYPVNYKEMGFQNGKTRKPNIQWALLQGLAKNHGQISWSDPLAQARYKKTKEILSKSLKAYFDIKDDPFYDYRKEKAYKIKLTLIPEVGQDPYIESQ